MQPVSVIVPVYQVEKYLRKCLDSIRNQTLRDIEIICINDASPDYSQKILKEYAEKDSRFILRKHSHNRGLSGARNTGIVEAKGEYIYFVDSDDFLACDDAIEVLYRRAVADNSDEIIGGILKWRPDTDEKYLDWHKNYLKNDIFGEPLKNLPQLRSNVIACNKLIRRNLISKHKIGFIEEIKKNEDNPFSIQVHVLAKRISIVTKTTYLYRQTQNGSLTSTIKKTDAINRCLYCYAVFEFIEEETSRHVFRKLYYQMYSKQLIESAKILSRFSPNETEIHQLLDRWKMIVDILPYNFPEIPFRQRQIFEYIKKGKMDIAWEKAMEF